YLTAVSYTCSRSGESCAYNACAPKAPNIVASASRRPAIASVRPLLTARAEQRLDQVERQREDDDLRPLVRDVCESLQGTQLHGAGLASEIRGRLDQCLRRLAFALGVDDLGAARTLRFGLLRHGANHGLIEIDVLDFHVGYLDTPCFGGLIENDLDVGVELF